MRKIVYYLCLVFIISCSENNSEPENSLNGEVISQTECKTFKSANNTESCIQFNYDENTKTLYITHINAGFNCCPGEISCDIVFQNSTITITEREEVAMCDCNCLFDIEIKINNVEKTSYTIEIIEPYIGDQEELIFDINLNSNTSGEYCVDRTEYPWGM